ncbi:unnamed protein product [Ectocarpus sp. 12 AP-2014]
MVYLRVDCLDLQDLPTGRLFGCFGSLFVIRVFSGAKPPAYRNPLLCSVASGYPVLIDTGGLNIGLNFGYCTLLVMEDLDVIPRDEVRSVNVQLVTYNGNQGSAFGSINIGFTFDHGKRIW